MMYAFRSLALIIYLTFLILSNVIAQKAPEVSNLEILPEEAVDVHFFKDNMRINERTGHPIALYQVNFPTAGDDYIEKAKSYLRANYKRLGLQHADLRDLKHHATRSTNAGTVVRFRQHINDVPVNKGELTVSMDPNNMVQMVMNSYETDVKWEDTSPRIASDIALASAMSHINPERLIAPAKNNLMIYTSRSMTRLAYDVVLVSDSPVGDWHVYVDALSGEIFKVEDMAYNCGHNHSDPKDKHACCNHDKQSASVPVDGSGMVFDPDPLSSNMVAYGGNYVDNGDNTNTDLDNSRFNVTLRDIDLTAGTYTLIGPWAEIVDSESPNNGLYGQATSTFNFNRMQDGFEAVNCYYHIDYLMRYINDTLGCSISPYQYSGGVRFDPHGLGGADNSHYITSTGQVAFGEGGVDDAEDSDVVHHELGHGLHDWVTSGGLSQVNGLSEGCGDYIAQSYNRAVGSWDPSDPAYHWVFNWDGHNPFWNGRITNYTATYPGGLVGQIHTDGQIWSTCCMGLWDAIGQQRMDKIFYEGLGMTNGSSSQDDAANAVYQAALNLSYTSAEISAIHAGFTSTGYTLPPLAGRPTADFSADFTTICLDDIDSISFFDQSISSPAATAWAWTFEGGTPATSSATDPVVTYTTEGTFDVTLIVTNINGSDTVTFTDYITTLQGTNCPSCLTGSNNTVIPISSSGAGNVYESTITIAGGGTITDVNVTNITGEHTFLGDLIFYLLNEDSSIIVQLNDDVCGTDEDFNVGFDDEGLPLPLPCPYTDGQLYQTLQPLSAFDGEDAAGIWRLRIIDDANLDGGELQSWSLEICVSNSNPCVTDLNLPTLSTGYHQASNSITSDATIAMPDSVRLKAGNFVELQNDFQVDSAAILQVDIGPCD